MEKLSKTEAKLKKSIAYRKECNLSGPRAVRTVAQQDTSPPDTYPRTQSWQIVDRQDSSLTLTFNSLTGDYAEG